MKKLLALVLCIAMIGSISVTAFAKTKTVEKPDLWPVVKQANHFYGALQKYDTMRNIVNLYNGFTGAFPKLFENNVELKELSFGFAIIFDAFDRAQFDTDTGKLVPPALEIFEGMPLTNDFLYALVNAAWYMLGDAYAGQYDGKLGNVNNGTITGAIANAENNIPTVTAPTAFPVDN